MENMQQGVASINLNRNFIGIEQDKGFFNVGTKRIKDHINCLDLKMDVEISYVSA